MPELSPAKEIIFIIITNPIIITFLLSLAFSNVSYCSQTEISTINGQLLAELLNEDGSTKIRPIKLTQTTSTTLLIYMVTLMNSIPNTKVLTSSSEALNNNRIPRLYYLALGAALAQPKNKNVTLPYEVQADLTKIQQKIGTVQGLTMTAFINHLKETLMKANLAESWLLQSIQQIPAGHAQLCSTMIEKYRPATEKGRPLINPEHFVGDFNTLLQSLPDDTFLGQENPNKLDNKPFNRQQVAACLNRSIQIAGFHPYNIDLSKQPKKQHCIVS